MQYWDTSPDPSPRSLAFYTTTAPQPAREVVGILRELTIAGPNSSDRLVPLVYAELRRRAGAYLRDERAGHTLQPTALVNEAYIRLVRSLERGWETRAQFVRVACWLMRRILIDHARRKKSAIRGGERRRVQLNPDIPSPPADRQLEELLDLDSALKKLNVIDPRKSSVVEMRYFGGLTVEETARALSISPRTVKSDWNLAKAWLRGEMLREA